MKKKWIYDLLIYTGGTDGETANHIADEVVKHEQDTLKEFVAWLKDNTHHLPAMIKILEIECEDFLKDGK